MELLNKTTTVTPKQSIFIETSGMLTSVLMILSEGQFSFYIFC